MKCIRCGNDCRYPERRYGQCPKCHKSFAFEPRTGDKFTDAGFQSAIDAVSSGGTVRFLPDHVYYLLARRKRDRGGLRAALLAGGGLSLFAMILNPVVAAIGAATLVGLGALARPSSHVQLERRDFDQMWKRWIQIHGTPTGLIVRKAALPVEPYRHSDLPQYSFDRAVICDRAETVDVLIANNFHFENNCAVLSADGYPAHVFDTVRAMLRKNPRLIVFVLHDATVEGCELADKLATDPAWFRGTARVIEVGLRPAHAPQFIGAWEPGSLRAATGRSITNEERKWLANHRLSLAAVRPEQVIKRLFAAVVAAEKPRPPAPSTKPKQTTSDTYAGGGGGVYVEATASFSAEADASDGGGDAFG